MDTKTIKPWELNQLKLNVKNGILVDSYSPFIERILIDKLKQKYFDDGLDVTFLSGDKLSDNWADDLVAGPDLFCSAEVFFVLNSGMIANSVVKKISEIDWSCISKKIVFLNCVAKNKVKFSKYKLPGKLIIEYPNFWEGDRLLDFLLEEKKITLDRRSKELIFKFSSSDISKMIPVLDRLILLLDEEGKVRHEDVIEVVPEMPVDQFELVKLLNEKRLNELFKKLLNIPIGEEVVGVISFLIAHLLKIYDPSYMKNKKRITKYDEQVLKASRLWKEPEISLLISRLREISVGARLKSDLSTKQMMRLSITRKPT